MILRIVPIYEFFRTYRGNNLAALEGVLEMARETRDGMLPIRNIRVTPAQPDATTVLATGLTDVHSSIVAATG